VTVIYSHNIISIFHFSQLTHVTDRHIDDTMCDV